MQKSSSFYEADFSLHVNDFVDKTDSSFAGSKKAKIGPATLRLFVYTRRWEYRCSVGMQILSVRKAENTASGRGFSDQSIALQRPSTFEKKTSAIIYEVLRIGAEEMENSITI